MVHGACLLFTGQRTSGGSALIWVFSHTINNKKVILPLNLSTGRSSFYAGNTVCNLWPRD